MDWERILLVFTDILLPLAAGYLLKIHNLMPQKACDWLIRFNVVVMVTVLTLMSFWVLPLSAQLLWLPLIGVLITAVPGVIGARCFAGQFDNELDRGAYVISAMLSNIGTIGGLCAFILYGEEGFAYVQLVAAPQNILMVAAAFPMAKYYYEKHHAAKRKAKLQLSFREMFITWNQVGILGMAAGILLQVFGVSRPPALGVLITAVPGVIGARCFAGQFDNELDRGAYVISAMLSNIGTIGGLCAFILYGEEGFAYVQLVAAPQNILMVAAAFPMAKYYYEKHHAAQRQAKLQLSFREMFITWNQVGILG
ncbi:MAG: hypothetical protein II389_06320, partial [Acidaminococcaceae bacterium]|nr:hypothetical protein [Acidaminococcaceae bacterium]